jgi:anti-sigma factor RsiW
MERVTRRTVQGPAGCSRNCLAGPLLDGELTPREFRCYVEHLRQCPECRAELRALRRLSQLLRTDRQGPWDPGPEDLLGEETESARVTGRQMTARSTTATVTAMPGGAGYGRR